MISGVSQNTIRKPQNLTMTLAFVVDEESPAQYLFLINGVVAFKTTEGLKKYLAQFPRESKLTWAPGCLRRGNEPLLESEKEMNSFRRFCKDSGINFVLVPSG